MGYNFREDQINEMYSLYVRSLEELNNQVSGVINELTKKSMELKYEPIINLSKEAIDYYNEDLKRDEIKAMNDWQDSELSFQNVMAQQRAGDSARSRSRALESRIEEEINGLDSIDSAQLDGIDTADWKCDQEDFEDILGIIEKFTRELENSRGTYSSRIESLKEENSIYVSIEPVILQTYSIVIEGFREGISNSYIELSRLFQESEQNIRSQASNISQNITSKAQSMVSDSVSSIKQKAKSIWE